MHHVIRLGLSALASKQSADSATELQAKGAVAKCVLLLLGRGAETSAAGQIWHECQCDHTAGRGHPPANGVGQIGL